MFDLNEGWSISFAGCGLLGISYVGVASYFLEKVPSLFTGAGKICRASAGALFATIVTTGWPIVQFCKDLMVMAREARKHHLGPLHPTIVLLKTLRDSLNHDLPADAHCWTSGKLCVSLTRVSDGKNVLVSQFDTREELIQALISSCFIPVYCGIVPPSLRRVRYVDGALSNNVPHIELKNTIAILAFSGESDICPKDNSATFHEVRLQNVSIKMSLGNMDRVMKVFFSQEPEWFSLSANQESGAARVDLPTQSLLQRRSYNQGWKLQKFG